MNIAIIANGFSGSTLPLAKCLSEVGHNVACYYICNSGARCIESIDFDNPLEFSFRPTKLSSVNRLYNYLNKDVDVFLQPNMRRHLKWEKLLVGHYANLINYILMSRLVKKIKRDNVDFVHLIVHTNTEVILCSLLKKNHIRFSVTYHEVFVGLNDGVGARLKPEVIKSLSFETPIIVHSEKTKSDLLRYGNDPTLKERIQVINFGSFDSYLSYGEGRSLNIEPGYLLYLGYIHPRKGVGVLYESAKYIDPNLGVRIVVAGKGYDPSIEYMKSDSRFTLKNRFIDNDELVWLMRNAKAVVCPYISASQSGLVQTAMTFNKHVIATRVGAFTEIIKDGVNGYIAEPGNPQSLAKAINLMYRRLDSLQMNYDIGYDWSNIVNRFHGIIQVKDK